MDSVPSGQTAGTTGQNLKIEAVCINASLSEGSHIQYQSHAEEYGWMDWVQDGEISGTTGENKRLEAIRIKLTGSDAKNYDIYYRAHITDLGWLSWAKDGEDAGSTGMQRQMEALQIVILPKGSEAPGSTARPFASVGMDPVTIGRVHSSGVGWTEGSLNGTALGTTGKSQALEALTFEFYDETPSGIDYMSHLSGMGWEEGWRSNGQLSGTTGQDRPIECVRIKLSGLAAQKYDIYYQAHVQNLGWLGWAKDGEPSGTTHAGLEMEALNVVILPKDSPAPGSTEEAWRSPISVEQFRARIHGCWLDTERAAAEINSYVSGFSDNYMFVGQNQTYNGFEGHYDVITANATGGKIQVTDYYTGSTYEMYLSFTDIPANHLKISWNGKDRELVRGDTTDGVHYTFSGFKQYGQLAVIELKNNP